MATNYFKTLFGVNDTKEELTQSGSKPEVPSNINVQPLIYPPEIRGNSERPCMVMTAHERKLSGAVHRHSIWFPAPSGLQFGDSGDYGSTDLGKMAGAVDALGKGSSVSEIGSRIASEIKSINAKQAASLAMSSLPDKYADAGALITQQVTNPNTNTTFNKNGVRTFTYAFKMIARSSAESNLIREIQSKFRKFIYASRGGEASTITLEYPPVWTIKFMNMDSGTENIFIPRIYSCYCTSVNSNFNANGNIYFSDNAPLEVDLEISFTETRALNRFDIEQMENDQLGNRGISAEGKPMASTQIEQPIPSPIKPG